MTIGWSLRAPNAMARPLKRPHQKETPPLLSGQAWIRISAPGAGPGHRRQTGRPTTDRCTCKQRAIPRFFSDHAWRFHPTFDTHFFTRIYFDNDPNENLTPPLPSPTSAHTTRRCTGGAASSATAQRVDVAKTTKRPVEATRPLSSGERGSFRAKRSGVRLCGSGTWAGRAEVVGMGAGRGTKWALKACLQPP